MTDTEATVPPQEPRARRRPGLAAKFLLLGVMSLLCLLAAECAVRLLAPQPPSWLAIYRHHPRLDTYAILPDIDQTIDNGETRWRIRTDDTGFRTCNGGPARKDQPLCLGDSFTFGQGVDGEASFLGRLAAASPPVEFINAGVPGYGPVQYQEVLDDLLGQGFTPPRVLVVVYLGNDFHDCVWKEDNDKLDNIVGGIIGNRGDLRSRVKRSSHLYRLAARVYHQFAPANPQSFDFREAMYHPLNWESGILAKGRSRFAEAFRRMAESCRQRGIPLAVALLPTRHAVKVVRGEEPIAPGGDPRLAAGIARELIEATGTPVLDLTDALAAHPVDDIFFKHDGHFSPVGHRVVAEALGPFLGRIADSDRRPGP